MALPTEQRKSIIKNIQFILFDVHDVNPHLLNYRYTSGFYNDIPDEELIEYYNILKHESKNLHGQSLHAVSEY
mgnify:CR=1 FL=1